MGYSPVEWNPQKSNGFKEPFDCVVVLLGVIVVRVRFVGRMVKTNMLSIKVRLTGAVFGRSVPITELTRSHLHAVNILT